MGWDFDWWDWRWTTVVLCLVGMTKEFQPSEPFFIDYAVDCRNFTASQMVHEILPWTTYTYFISLLILMLITDLLRYKPIIIFGGFGALGCWIMTIWFYDSVRKAQLRQVTDAVFFSTELAYMTYMYANVERAYYRKVTGYSHAALHLGRFFAGVTGQLLLSTETMSLENMNYLSLGGVSLSLLISLFLPKVRRSIYFDPRVSVISTLEDGRGQGQQVRGSRGSIYLPRKMAISIPKPEEVSAHKRVVRAGRALWRDFKIAYKNRYVLKWSLWWSIAQAIYLQVQTYEEALWKEIEDETYEHESIYNGGIDASHALLSAVLGICIAYLRFPMLKYGEIYLATISLLQSAVLLWMSQTSYLYVAYGCYVVFQTLFQVVIIIATAEIAESIKEDSEAFIFGLNTLLALIIQTVLTYAIADESGFDLEIREEFVVYGVYLAILGVIFGLIGVQRRTRHWDLEVGVDSATGNGNNNGTDNGTKTVQNETEKHTPIRHSLSFQGTPSQIDGERTPF